VLLLTDMIVNYRQEQHLERARAAASQAYAHPTRGTSRSQPCAMIEEFVCRNPGSTWGHARTPHRARIGAQVGQRIDRSSDCQCGPLSIARTLYRHLPNDFKASARGKTQTGTALEPRLLEPRTAPMTPEQREEFVQILTAMILEYLKQDRIRRGTTPPHTPPPEQNPSAAIS
jgi:hypothetical protein